MGVVVFKWGFNKLTLLQNREQRDSWAIEPAAWDEDNMILSGLPEDNFGTWCGISRRGRVAFVVDALLGSGLSPSEHRPVDFLRGEVSPMDFARKWSANSSRLDWISDGVSYYMIVADINSNSMVYVSKKSPKVLEVAFGVHTLSSIYGLDSDDDYEVVRQKTLFSDMIGKYKRRHVPPLKEMAESFIYKGDRWEASSSSVDTRLSYETMSTTALAVKPKPTKEVIFYERYLENGEWKDHHFTFNIAA